MKRDDSRRERARVRLTTWLRQRLQSYVDAKYGADAPVEVALRDPRARELALAIIEHERADYLRTGRGRPVHIFAPPTGRYVSLDEFGRPQFQLAGKTVMQRRGDATVVDHFGKRGRPSRKLPDPMRALANRELLRACGSAQRLGGIRSGENRRAQSALLIIIEVAKRLRALDRLKGSPPNERGFAGRVVAELERAHSLTVTQDYVRKVLKRAGTATPATT